MTATTPVVVPEWLTLRSGTLKPGVKPETQFVMIGTQPLYRLDLRPAGGRFTCAVVFTVNGSRLDDGVTTYATPHEAYAGGLEQLRNKLGW
jgi:hypothetical protein